MTKLFSFASILLATRSKFISEDSKKMKKFFIINKIFCRTFLWSFDKIYFILGNYLFCLKSSEMYGKMFSIKLEQKATAQIFGTKTQFGHFWRGWMDGRGGGVDVQLHIVNWDRAGVSDGEDFTPSSNKNLPNSLWELACNVQLFLLLQKISEPCWSFPS